MTAAKASYTTTWDTTVERRRSGTMIDSTPTQRLTLRRGAHMGRAIYPIVLLLLSLLSLIQPLAAQPIPADRTDQFIVMRPGYDYAPAVIFDDGKYRLYWCAGIAGDFILHSESQRLEGPWYGAKSGFLETFDIALRPTGSRADFDGLHTCDPNVIKVGRAYYLYYGGNFADDGLTAVGVARSSDGVHFQGMNNGKPIFTAAKSNPDFVRGKLTYGAGQPAALFLDGFFYLSISDSTGSGSNPGNGAGQFLLRARDPAFQSGVQELTRAGWKDREAGQHTAEFSLSRVIWLRLDVRPFQWPHHSSD